METERNNKQDYNLKTVLDNDKTTNALLHIAKALNNVAEAIAGSGDVLGLNDALHRSGTPPLSVALSIAVKDGLAEAANILKDGLSDLSHDLGLPRET